MKNFCNKVQISKFPSLTTSSQLFKAKQQTRLTVFSGLTGSSGGSKPDPSLSSCLLALTPLTLSLVGQTTELYSNGVFQNKAQALPEINFTCFTPTTNYDGKAPQVAHEKPLSLELWAARRPPRDPWEMERGATEPGGDKEGICWIRFKTPMKTREREGHTLYSFQSALLILEYEV